MPDELVEQNKSLFALSDDLSAYFESREMIAAQLAEPQQPEDAAELRRQLAEVDLALERLGAEVATKTDHIAGLLRRMATEQDYLAAEAERIRSRKHTMERAEEWLRKYVVSVMTARGMKQLKTASNTLFLRGSDAVVVTDGTAVPPEFKNVTVKMPMPLWKELAAHWEGRNVPELRITEDISLSNIKKAIKSGVDVDGADLEFRENLVLR